MNVDWIENGWRRFLDRLKELWGKRDDPSLQHLADCEATRVLTSGPHFLQ
jgi:hypothetical protein